jgi:O-antigen/teichoic acid export membrane protein
MLPLHHYLEKYPLFRDRVLPLIASPTRRRLASGAFWAGVGGLISRGIVVSASFIIARILGQTQFGEYGVVNSTAAMLSAVAGFGVGTTATKYVAELKFTDQKRAGRIIALSSMITWISGALYGIVFIAFAPWLAEKTLGAPHLAGVLRISSISVFLGVINGAQTCSLAGFEAFSVSAFINMGCGLLQAIFVVMGAYWGGVKGAVIGMAVSTCVTVITTSCLLRKEMERFGIGSWWREAWSEWPVLVKFSLPAFLITMVAGPVTWAGNAILANQPNGYAELGVLNATNQWYAAVAFLPSLITTAALPVFAERYGANDSSSSLRIMKGMMSMTAIAVIPLLIVLSLASKMIMLAYGAGFETGYRVLVLSIITAGVHAIVTPCWFFLMASGRMWVCLIMNLGWGLIFLIGILSLVKFGAEGVAGTRLMAYVLHGFWIVGYVFLSNRQKTKSNSRSVCRNES